MTAAQKEADQAWRTYVLGRIHRFCGDARVPLLVLLSGKRASPRVSRLRYVRAARLRDELGLTYSQLATLFHLSDRTTARYWTVRGRLPDPATRPPGVPDSRQLALRFV